MTDGETGRLGRGRVALVEGKGCQARPMGEPPILAVIGRDDTAWAQIDRNGEHHAPQR